MPEISPIINGGAISRWVESTPSEETLLTLNENGQVVASNAVMQAALPCKVRIKANEYFVVPVDHEFIHTQTIEVEEGGVLDVQGVLTAVNPAATENSTDAQLRDRSTHTGVQPIESVIGLQETLDTILSAIPIFSEQPQDAEVFEGEDASFAVSTYADDVEFQWHISEDDGETWSELPGETTPTLHITNPQKADSDGILVLCESTKNNIKVRSNPARLNVWNPTNLPIDYWIDFRKNTFTDRSTTPTTTANLGDPIGTVLSVGNSSLGFSAFSDVSRPTRTSLGASFDGVDDAMNGFATVRDTTKNKEYVGVFVRAFCPSAQQCLVSAGEGASLNPRLQLQATPTSVICSTRRVDGDTTYVTSATGLDNKSGAMLGFGLVRDFESGRISLLRDGESVKTETYSSQGFGATSDTSSQRYVIGGTVGLTSPLRYTGVIGEVVGITTRLSADEEIKLTKYLNR